MKNIFFLFISFLISTFSLLSMDQLENYIKEAENAEKSGKKDEALQWYGKAAAVTVTPGANFDEKQRELQEKGARKIVIETMKLKAQKKYDEAIKIYKYAGDRFKTEIAQIEALQKPQQPIEEIKKDWIFITEIPGEQEQETDYWRIQDGRLDLNKNEKDPIIVDNTFGQMMQEAQNKHIPFFLVMIEVQAAKKTLSFYEGKNVIRFLEDAWQRGIFFDPRTKAPATKIVIFVMGDDGKFFKVKEVGVGYINVVYLKNIVGNEAYYLNNFDILSEKGKAQLFVADLFKEEAQNTTDQNKKQNFLQYAQQWYKWALKYLPRGSASVEKDWIFLTEMPGEKKQEADRWRIIEDSATKKYKLELNKNARDYITYETFVKMMQEAQDNHIPFFLVMVATKNAFDLYEGKNAIYFLVNFWNKNHVLIDPKTKDPITNITIFVMGDDNKFTKLREKAEAELYLGNFVEFVDRPSKIIKFKDILSEKGKAQLFVANLFQEEAQRKSNQKERQEILQYARQWYEWALKYLPVGSPEYIRAQQEIQKIPNQKLLIQNLQNLTTKLRQIPAKLV